MLSPIKIKFKLKSDRYILMGACFHLLSLIPNKFAVDMLSNVLGPIQVENCELKKILFRRCNMNKFMHEDCTMDTIDRLAQDVGKINTKF